MNKKFTKIGIIVIALVVLIGSFTIARADFGSSLLDMIANIAGQRVGDNINQKLEESGALNAPVGDLAFGAGVLPGTEDNLVKYLRGDFTDATTTFVSFVSPFLAATSSADDVVVKGSYPNGYTVASTTIDLGRLNVTGVATSSFYTLCYASQTAYATSSATYSLISSDTVGTSTKAFIENNISSSYGTNIGGGSVAKIVIGPSAPYLLCRAIPSSSGAAVDYANAFTNVSNTFDGTYLFRASKTQY